MSLSTLPLSYCTNVHPGVTVDAIVEGLQTYTAAAARGWGERLAAGLWLAEPVITELETSPGALDRLQGTLSENGLTCYTLNAFPQGNFHSERVKEQVYLPDWSSERRRQYTSSCARVLARLLPEGCEGSLSTVPLGFKELPQSADFVDRCIEQLLATARLLDEIHDATGRVLRLAIEPEPVCVLETTEETLAFFGRLFAEAERQDLSEVARRHLGVCYDVCHQSVEFEDVAGSIAQLQQADVRINKVHITCAVRALKPWENAEVREALTHFVEPRYLHQTMARTADGQVVRHTDLSVAFCEDPPETFRHSEEWRVHFHVPVSEDRLGPLETTRGDLRRALEAVRDLPYAPHLEVETYTWGVLPTSTRPPLVEGLVAELESTRRMLGELREERREL